jgi:tetratricopeptide (TPR) repeat protein
VNGGFVSRFAGCGVGGPSRRRTMGEIYFQQGNLQPAANQFRNVLAGDLDPKWIEVWSHLNLGKIFDASGQRERAINEYRQAQRTKDNTQGAPDEAAIYLELPHFAEVIC